MNNNSGTSPLMQASLSHYIAEKDKVLAELDIHLNRPIGSGGKATVTDEVILLFKKLSDAQNVIELITGIIEDNKKEKLSILEKLDVEKNNLVKPTPPTGQIVNEY